MSQETPPPIDPNAGSNSKGFAASLTESAGAATKLVGLQAERTKLTTITLPAAYRALGKDCIQQKRHLDGAKEMIEQLQTVVSEIKTLSEASNSQTSSQSLTDKAKAAGKQALDLARKKQLEMKRESLCGDIGKAIYKIHSESSGAKEVISPIQVALNRVSELDSEIAKLSGIGKGTWITPKRLLVTAAVVLGLVIVAGLSTKEEYVPYVPGTKKHYLTVLYPPGSPPIVTIDEEIYQNEGVIESAQIKQGVLIDESKDEPTIDNVKWVSSRRVTQSKKHQRVKDGFVESGSELYSGGIAWEKTLKIGAKIDEEWQDQQSGDNQVFHTVTKRETWGGKKALVIRKTTKMGELTAIAFTTYASGIGEVDTSITLIVPGGSPPMRKTLSKVLLTEKQIATIK